MSTIPAAAPVKKLWGGRFTAGPAPELDRINRSLPVDHRLWREDVAGSQAWALALTGAGVISPAEGAALRAGLDRVAERLE
ncbi:MAG: argininosuccinate lyase, partial [Gemmatimonadota bacterium]|nr:argininosuccinate lyase [Gemmatimonadota bacterium]